MIILVICVWKRYSASKFIISVRPVLNLLDCGLRREKMHFFSKCIYVHRLSTAKKKMSIGRKEDGSSGRRGGKPEKKIFRTKGRRRRWNSNYNYGACIAAVERVMCCVWIFPLSPSPPPRAFGLAFSSASAARIQRVSDR